MNRLKDCKATLNGSGKPDLTHMRRAMMVYTSRACEYGNDKYVRSNYLRPTDSVAEDVERLRTYMRATISHIQFMLDDLESHQSQDPGLENEEGIREAILCPDLDEDGSKIGPSGLPHISHACASIMMGLQQAVDSGLLPKDPGTPWRDEEEDGNGPFADSSRWIPNFEKVYARGSAFPMMDSTAFTASVPDFMKENSDQWLRGRTLAVNPGLNPLIYPQDLEIWMRKNGWGDTFNIKSIKSL